MKFTTMKAFQSEFTKGLSDGIRVRSMNEENIDNFCDMMQQFFQSADNDFWLNCLDTGIYQIEYGMDPVLIILVTPGLVQFRLCENTEFAELEKGTHKHLANGALGVFAFIGVFEGDLDFDQVFSAEKPNQQVIKVQKKHVSKRNVEPWIL